MKTDTTLPSSHTSNMADTDPMTPKTSDPKTSDPKTPNTIDTDPKKGNPGMKGDHV